MCSMGKRGLTSELGRAIKASYWVKNSRSQCLKKFASYSVAVQHGYARSGSLTGQLASSGSSGIHPSWDLPVILGALQSFASSHSDQKVI